MQKYDSPSPAESPDQHRASHARGAVPTDVAGHFTADGWLERVSDKGQPWLNTPGCPLPQSLQQISAPSFVAIVLMLPSSLRSGAQEPACSGPMAIGRNDAFGRRVMFDSRRVRRRAGAPSTQTND